MTEPVEEDSSSLIPGLLAIVAAYTAYKAVRGQIDREWQAMSVSLGFGPAVGLAVANLAIATLDRERRERGRTGDELLNAAGTAVGAGVDAGFKTIADALRWMDDQPRARQHTKDYDEDGVIPTQSEPPRELASMVAQSVVSSTLVTAAVQAGWMYKVWVTNQDGRVRYTHQAMHGQRVPIEVPFRLPSGTRMRWPGDPMVRIEERINCRCWVRVVRT